MSEERKEAIEEPEKKGAANLTTMKSMLMTRLFKDGFITKDEDGVFHVDVRVDELKKVYGDKESTIQDIKILLGELIAGLKKTGNKVEVTRLYL